MIDTPQIRSLANFTGGHDWRLALLHDDPSDLLIWVARGQGLLHTDGSRRGVGAHNAILIPHSQVFALDLGRQANGLVAIIPPAHNSWNLETARQLRIRDAKAISQLSGFIEAAQREVSDSQPILDAALSAHQRLIEVWVRRQITPPEHAPAKQNASIRLIRRFFANLPQPKMKGATMAEHAEQLGVTPTHLARASCTATGVTTADHLTARLLHQTQTALVDTKTSAKDIATQLRFSSATYFTRFVQQQMGKTPTQLRQQT